MKPKQILKISTDVLMTAVLMLLMAYSLVGEAAHEWLGMGMFALFILHHCLNSKWSQNIYKGKYTAYRALQTILVILCLLSMLGCMISGIVLSKHALSFLSIEHGSYWARPVHMLASYWGYVFLSLHIGLHWNTMLGMAKKLSKKPYAARSWIFRILGLLIAAYGAYAFFKREIGAYMTLQNMFVFFDFDEPLICFLLDYSAVMGLFVCIGHYLAMAARKIKRSSL